MPRLHQCSLLLSRETGISASSQGRFMAVTARSGAVGTVSISLELGLMTLFFN